MKDMNSTTKHTHNPTPWKHHGNSIFEDKSGKVCGPLVAEATIPNAAYIVQCVNAHDRLVEACKLAIHEFGPESDGEKCWDAIDALKAAITLAEGGKEV